jgi:hypothetical protein
MTATISDELKVNSLKVGNVASPPDISAGSGEMATANRVQGAVHLRTDADQPIECLHNSEVRKLGFADQSLEARLATLTANGVTTYTTYMPADGIITGVRRRYTTVPASASGTVTVGITVAGNQILASASENEEGLTNDTLASHNLTGTPANLTVSRGDKVVITITSNNADMTGGTEGMYYIDYDQN